MPRGILRSDLHVLSIIPTNIAFYQRHLAKNTTFAFDYIHLLVTPGLYRYVFTEKEPDKLLKEFLSWCLVVRGQASCDWIIGAHDEQSKYLIMSHRSLMSIIYIYQSPSGRMFKGKPSDRLVVCLGGKTDMSSCGGFLKYLESLFSVSLKDIIECLNSYPDAPKPRSLKQCRNCFSPATRISSNARPLSSAVPPS